MSTPESPHELHYLGVRIEKSLWQKLRSTANSNDDSVGKLVRKILNTWANADNKII